MLITARAETDCVTAAAAGARATFGRIVLNSTRQILTTDPDAVGYPRLVRGTGEEKTVLPRYYTRAGTANIMTAERNRISWNFFPTTTRYRRSGFVGNRQKIVLAGVREKNCTRLTTTICF